MASPIATLFWSFTRRHWLLYLLGLFFVFATNLTEVLTPKFVQWALDLVSAGGIESLPTFMQRSTKLDSLHVVLTLLASMMFVAMLLRGAWRQTLARATHLATQDLRMQMWDRLRWQSLASLAKYPLGDIMNRMTGDLRAARVIFGFTIVLTSDVIFFGFLSVGAMLLIDWQITLIVMGVFVLVTRPVVKLARYEMVLHERAQKTLSRMSDVISQCVASVRMQRASAADGPWRQRLEEQATRYAGHQFQVKRVGQLIFPYGAAPTLCAYVCLLTLGIVRLLQGEMTIGEFVAMQSLVFMLQIPLYELGDCIAEWQTGLASLRRICELTSLATESVPAPSTGEPREVATVGVLAPAVECLDLGMAFGERVVFAHVDLTIESGEHIGIFGQIGAGKSTFLEIIAGLQRPPSGLVRLWGAPVDQWHRRERSRNVGYVPQAPFLFSGTLRHNLVLDGEATDEELWEILRVVDLEKDMATYADGLDTVIGEWGVTLSGGQRQRFSLARALLRRPKLLLLDDCVSAVDASTEETIVANLARYLQGTTVIWVAHRVSTLRHADRVFQMDGGRLAQVARDSLEGR